jgi:mRNA interferase HigB
LHIANVTVSNRKAIALAMRKHARLRRSLAAWLEIAESAAWRDIIEARETFPTADAIKGTDKTCFNIGGNNFRLIAVISYTLQQIVVHEVLTHAEYTKRYTG